MSAPGLVRWLVGRLLPHDLREPVLGDLEELFTRRLAEGWPVRRARAEYRRLAWRSLADAAARDHGEGRHEAGDPMMLSLLDDVRYALRTFGRSPGFALPALLTMAVGIGVATAVFSLADVLLFRPLPYAAPDRLVFLLGWDTVRDTMRFNVPHDDLPELAAATPLEAAAAYGYWDVALSGADLPERVQGYKVSSNMFDMLGVPAAFGRTFSGGADTGSVVLSDGLWRRAFGGDPSVVGRTLRLNDAPFVVIGVMPRSFEFPVYNFKGELWVPYAPGEDADQSVVALGRLAPGRSIGEAQAALDAVSATLQARHPDTHRGRGIRVMEMHELGAREARPAVVGLLAATGLLLLLACANIAELLLARGVVRQHELATRLALGAGRGRIVRQLLTESLVLAALGAGLGVIVAGWALDVFTALLPEGVLTTLPGITALGLDARTIVVAVLLTAVAGLGAGLLPAWRGARSQDLERLGTAGRTAGGRGERRIRFWLIAAEVTLSFALVVASGVVLRGVTRLLDTDPGFQPGDLLTFAVSLPDSRYETAAARDQFVRRVSDRLAALPGVTSVAAVNTLPFSTYNQRTRIAVGDAGGEDEPVADLRTATAGYFDTMGIPLVEGRSFRDDDRRDGEPVVVVNEAFVGRYLAGGRALGRQVRVGGGPGVPRRIVGVAGSVRHEGLAEAVEPEVYVPLAQAPPELVMFAVRGAGRPLDLIFPVRRALGEIDAGVPAFHLRTMTEAVRTSAAAPLLTLRLMAAFGLLAFALACFGMHAVVSQAVSQQGREMAVRVALGAAPATLARQVLGGALRPTFLGLLLGGLAAYGLAGALAGVVAGIDPASPTVFLGGALVLTTAALAAAAGPTRRAIRADTAQALRGE